MVTLLFVTAPLTLLELEKLIDEAETLNLDKAQKEKINMVYRLLNGMYE